MVTQEFELETLQLIDNLKGVCASYGLGNDGNEFKIITQMFLYKFLNDKFAYEIKKISPKISQAEEALHDLSEREFGLLQMQVNPYTARLKPEHLLSRLLSRHNEAGFAQLFDNTLRDIAAINNDIFAVKTHGGAGIVLFDRVSEYVTDESKRDSFCRALINKLTDFSFECVFTQKYDFFAAIFEYLIKDYNKDSGGKYAEYYTPHAVAKIMAAILVPVEQRGKVQNASCYDPSAGSGTLLMSLAHAIGEQRCSIFSQDISQKSSSLLRLNLILNNLVHSIPNIIQGNTMLHPYHRDGNSLRKFDYIVSNPPFKMDFSDYREDLESSLNKERFFAGVPGIPKKAKEKMAIYQLFLQHIIHSLKPNGKAAVVVPTGFIATQAGIDRAIRQKLVEEKMLAGVVSMPSNIFATTGTNVSILFMDRSNRDDVVLIDASNLGTKVKDGKNQKTLLSEDEEDHIISTFNAKQSVDGFSVLVSYDQIAEKNYSLSAGQYFSVGIDYTKLTASEFAARMREYTEALDSIFASSAQLEEEVKKQLARLNVNPQAVSQSPGVIHE